MNFLDKGRRNELPLIRRHQKNGFNLWRQTEIHPRHLEFIVKVRNSAQTAENAGCARFLREMHQQVVKSLYLNISVFFGHIGQIVTHHFHPFLQVVDNLYHKD